MGMDLGRFGMTARRKTARRAQVPTKECGMNEITGRRALTQASCFPSTLEPRA